MWLYTFLHVYKWKTDLWLDDASIHRGLFPLYDNEVFNKSIFIYFFSIKNDIFIWKFIDRHITI